MTDGRAALQADRAGRYAGAQRTAHEEASWRLREWRHRARSSASASARTATSCRDSDGLRPRVRRQASITTCGSGPRRASRTLCIDALYHFRWFWDYSGGQMTNLGAHDIDFVHYLLGVKGPTPVYSSGGRFALDDDGETPDTQDAILDYPGFTVVVSLREASDGRQRGGTEFFGTKGSMTVGRGGYEVFPDMRIASGAADSTMVESSRTSPSGRHQARASHAGAKRRRARAASRWDCHAQNFLDCIKSRQTLGRGRRRRPRGHHGLPPGEPVDETRPQAAMGCRTRKRSSATRRRAHAGPAVSQAVGPGV